MQKNVSHKITQKPLKEIANKNFYDKHHFIDPNYTFVKNERYNDMMIERIKEPSINCLALYPKLLPILNNITKLSLGDKKGLGELYIAKQLEDCKELVLIRNIHDATISHYLRFDVFVDLPSAPCGLAMYKIPGLKNSSIITQLTLKILKDELENRVNLSDSNPDISLILRTDNPRIYQMRAKLTDKIYPDLRKVESAINNFLVNKIKSFIQHNQFFEINELLQRKIIIREDQAICYTIEDVKASMPALALNLKTLKMHQGNKSSIINLLASQVDEIYKKHIPIKYVDNTLYIIRKMFGHNESHDYDLLIARNVTPNIKINKNKELAHERIINEFYEYYSQPNIRSCLMINFLIDLKGINQRLNENSAIFNKFVREI